MKPSLTAGVNKDRVVGYFIILMGAPDNADTLQYMDWAKIVLSESIFTFKYAWLVLLVNVRDPVSFIFSRISRLAC